MQIRDSVVLVTGANRGIGQALVNVLLERGARRVYAAARDPSRVVIPPSVSDRIVPLELDVTKAQQVAAAAKLASDVSIVINNAGSLASYGVLSSSFEAIELDVRTNYLGPLAVARAFAPVLASRQGGALVNVLTVASLASMPSIGGYSASKAAAFSLTQALRAELLPMKIDVHAAYPGPVDTDMVRHFDLPKASPESVARAIVAGVEHGRLEIVTDPMSEQVYGAWLSDPLALAQKFASGA